MAKIDTYLMNLRTEQDSFAKRVRDFEEKLNGFSYYDVLLFLCHHASVSKKFSAASAVFNENSQVVEKIILGSPESKNHIVFKHYTDCWKITFEICEPKTKWMEGICGLFFDCETPLPIDNGKTDSQQQDDAEQERKLPSGTK